MMKLYFICATSSVARQLAALAYKGKLRSIYRTPAEARAAYWNYPPSLRNKYAGFHVLVGEDGFVIDLYRLSGFIDKPRKLTTADLGLDEWER